MENKTIQTPETKKDYEAPRVDIIKIDNEIALIMASSPPEEPF